MGRFTLLLALSAALLAGCAATRPSEAPEPADPFLWRVTQTDAPGTLFLLGSVHLRDPERAALDRAVWDAVDAADTVLLEADVSNQLRLAFSVMKLGMLPPAESLKDHVTEKTYALLRERVEALGAQPSTFERMRPWLAAVSVLALEMEAQGLSPEGGVDLAVREAATARGARLGFLETAEQQLRLFADLDPQLQEDMLLDALQPPAGASSGQQVLQLMEIYESGDVDALEFAVLAPFEDAPELRSRLLDDRNRAWMPALMTALQRDAVTLATVGAGHLLGDQGLIALLRASGATVERVRGMGLVRADPTGSETEDAETSLASWQRYDAPALQFSVELPAAPRRDDVPPLFQVQSGLRWVVDREAFAFSVTALGFAELAAPALRRDAEGILDASFRDAARELNGQLGARTDLDVRTGRAQEQIVELPGGRLWIRGYVVGARVYELRAVLTREAMDDPRFLEAKDRFFESFLLSGPVQVVLRAPPNFHRRATGATP